MKRNVLRFALPILALIGLPLFFNSCKGGLLGTGLSSAKSCKVGLEKGLAVTMEMDENAVPKAFASGKVQLRTAAAASGSGVSAKATAALELNAGSRLSVILDNSCLQNTQATVISQMALASGERQEAYSRQAYSWELDRTYSEDEINDIAAQDACVVGVGWNKDYTIESTVFNDSGFQQQNHFAALHAQEAYDLFYAGTGTGGMRTTGTAVNVAVLDTGVDWTHPDIQPNILLHRDGVGIDITTYGGTIPVNYNPVDVSDIGHGTHVTGLIAAVANNNMGTVGLMPYRAKIIPIKIFKRAANGDLSTNSTYFYNAIKFAYLNNAQVVNLSFGSVTAGPVSDPVTESGIDEAIAKGVVVVTVIGNADSGNGVVIDGTTMTAMPGILSSKPGVLGVGSFDIATGNKSYFSHYSTTYAEIGAPGSQIYSTVPTALGSFATLSGTSQAAPLVSAAAALTIGLIRNSYSVPPTPAEVERLLLSSAVKSSNLTTYFKDGNRLDLLSLVNKINADYPATRTSTYVNVASSGCN